MFTHCIFCYAALGANEAIEEFSVGRRLAFDPARGRLWVVCRSCSQWNLSPLEERWEALEACERIFRSARARVATEHIGLARAAEGVELIRIGTPPRGEFAAWRYGERLMRRARRHAWLAAGAGGTALGFVAAVKLGLISFGLLGPAVMVGPAWIEHMWRRRRTVTHVDVDGERYLIRGRDAALARLVAAEQAPWQLIIPHHDSTIHVRGEHAPLVLGRVLAHINQEGGRRRRVQQAVATIESTGGADAIIDAAARAPAGALEALDPTQRLALEMAAHEGVERRAVEGELELLEQAWREAEEVAAIADALTLPAHIHERIGLMRTSNGSETAQPRARSDAHRRTT